MPDEHKWVYDEEPANEAGDDYVPYFYCELCGARVGCGLDGKIDLDEDEVLPDCAQRREANRRFEEALERLKNDPSNPQLQREMRELAKR